MPLKVLITTNIPSPYFVNYANELGKYVELTVAFELDKGLDRDKTWDSYKALNFKPVFLKAFRLTVESGLSFKIKKYLRHNQFDRIIIANPTTPTGVVSLLYCRKHKIPFIIQSEGGFQGTGKSFKEKFKKHIMEKATFYLTGMGGQDDYFLKYGATQDTLKKYPFSSLYKKDLLIKPISSKEKDNLKLKLKINYKHVVLYVGRFIDVKDIPTLLKSFQNFNDDTCLLLVGGNKKKEYEKLETEYKLKNIIYLSFKNKNDINDYYKIADVLVFTSKGDTWGLVINEAMAFGLPIISSNKSIAATQLIKNGENGFLVDVGDYDSINKYLKTLLNNEKMCKSMSINNMKKIKDYTIENMALTIFNYIK